MQLAEYDQKVADLEVVDSRRRQVWDALTAKGFRQVWTTRAHRRSIECWLNSETCELRLVLEYLDGSGIDVFKPTHHGNSMADTLANI